MARSDHSVITLIPLYQRMADTKKDRDEQACDAEDRQREQELDELHERADEAEPPRDGQDEARRERDDSPDSPRKYHRRGCNEPATFVVLERYQEETGHGAVEAEAFLCTEHTAEERPTNLDEAYADCVFRVESITETVIPDTA